MKPMSSRFFAALALSLAMSGCVAAPAPAPAPVVAPTLAPTPAPAPVAVAVPVYENWMDAPQTPGNWEYVDEPTESLALFGDANPVHLFVIRCNKQNRQVGIARRGETSTPLAMRVLTETSQRVLSATQVPDFGLIAATVWGNDPLLDAMAISKGRFAVEMDGFANLYIPSWPEVTRVIEDCR